MLDIKYIPLAEFARVQAAGIEAFAKLELIAEMCRLNTLSTVKVAGSGHLGSSLSALDLFTLLYFSELNLSHVGLDSHDRDVFFSSKGHDCPGHYAVLAAAGIIGFDKLLKLRRIGGLDGHPDVKIPGMEINSGSLGMGISKAKGIAIAKKLRNSQGRVLVLTGDGELQEGQIWESLQTAAHQKINNITAIVDCNKIQTDKSVEEIIGLGDIEKKFEVFGWHVSRCNGNDLRALAVELKGLALVVDKPKVLIADTVKGKGVSFMEGPSALGAAGGLYRWHSGAPDDDSYEAGFNELYGRISTMLAQAGLEALSVETAEKRARSQAKLKDGAERVVTSFGEALVELGTTWRNIVVLDADLSADCGLRPFEKMFPERFLENGIAEQDMVSAAGGLALHGFLPIVNSFGVFLASRANEQIYANATENTKIIYVCHYAGLIPAGPGKSHQSLRDISLFGALPNCVSLEPCNALETKMALKWCVEEAQCNCHLRLVISPSPRSLQLPDDYALTFGRGATLTSGTDAVLFSYGPVMLNEALVAAERLSQQGCSLKVVNMPWLNRCDETWVEEVVGDCRAVFSLDNHSTYGGLGDLLVNIFARSEKLHEAQIHKMGVEEYPACGTPQEALSAHGLDGVSLAGKIIQYCK